MTIPFSISARHRGRLSLLMWGIACFLLLRHGPYGLDDGAAKALLMSWSISDQVASSVITFGTPDLRTLLFLPTGFLWSGNILAAKILTVFLSACAVWLLYNWKQRNADTECALVASGLLLISPAVLEQIDSLSPAIFLLVTFVLGAWMDTNYRTAPKSFGGWYFAQLLLSAFSVSLHPAGLAYPLALIWSWHTNPVEHRQQRFLLGGIIFASLFIIIVRMGWPGLAWFQNPINSLGSILSGTPLDDGQAITTPWLFGCIILLTLVVVIFKQNRLILSDLLGRTLFLGLLLSALIGDAVLELNALTIILYFGLPILLRSAHPDHKDGFMKQRGWILLLVFIFSSFFMHADRTHYETYQIGMLSAQDKLIKTLADEAENSRRVNESDDSEKSIQHFIVASQWPSRTMIACKCDTLPLPPPAHDPQAQLANLKGITHLLLDPKQTANVDLTRNLSLLGGTIETISLQPGGVMLEVKREESPAQQGNKP